MMADGYDVVHMKLICYLFVVMPDGGCLVWGSDAGVRWIDELCNYHRYW